jgi:hypothetical protein
MTIREHLKELNEQETVVNRSKRNLYKNVNREFNKENPIKPLTKPDIKKSFQTQASEKAANEHQLAILPNHSGDSIDANVTAAQTAAEEKKNNMIKWGGGGAVAVAAGLGAMMLAKKLRAKKAAAKKKEDAKKDTTEV